MALCGRTAGGKGNAGHFIERQPQICAAGITSAQQTQTVGDSMKQYLLQDEVEALIHDAIIPLPRSRPQPKKNDEPIGLCSEVINPKPKSKMHCIAENLKETVYSSYFNKPLGKVRDPVPFLPPGFDMMQTLGKKLDRDVDSAYEIIFPRKEIPGPVTTSMLPGKQICRNYNAPPFNPTGLYGKRIGIDIEGKRVQCCLTDDRQILETGLKVVVSSKLADHKETNVPRLGKVLQTINKTKYLPGGSISCIKQQDDDITQCMSYCQLHSDAVFYKKCLAHINSLRMKFSKRFMRRFYHDLYLNLKYYDVDKSDWLPKKRIYDHCETLQIRLSPDSLEPLLEMWDAFDGSRIEYRTFVDMLNHTKPMPQLKKLSFIPPECLNYDTEYRSMTRPGQELDTRPGAGVGSSFLLLPDTYCQAHKLSVPNQNTVKCTLSPSALTHTTVTHRDMFAVRQPGQVRRVFEAAGDSFSDEQFDALWKEAQKHHSQGLVCYETFRRAIKTLADKKRQMY